MISWRQNDVIRVRNSWIILVLKYNSISYVSTPSYRCHRNKCIDYRTAHNALYSNCNRLCYLISHVNNKNRCDLQISSCNVTTKSQNWIGCRFLLAISIHIVRNVRATAAVAPIEYVVPIDINCVLRDFTIANIIVHLLGVCGNAINIVRMHVTFLIKTIYSPMTYIKWTKCFGHQCQWKYFVGFWCFICNVRL